MSCHNSRLLLLFNEQKSSKSLNAKPARFVSVQICDAFSLLGHRGGEEAAASHAFTRWKMKSNFMPFNAKIQIRICK